MELKFQAYIRLCEYVNTAGAVYLPSTWTGTETADRNLPQLPSIDVGLPSVKKTGKIVILQKEKNPIYLQMSDGSKLFLTLDEFRRIKGEPKVGKMMTVVFQRNPIDLSEIPSQINSIQIH